MRLFKSASKEQKIRKRHERRMAQYVDRDEERPHEELPYEKYIRFSDREMQREYRRRFHGLAKR
jgi:hypothetical protein